MQHIGTVPFETPRLICRRFCYGDSKYMLRNWAADPNIQYEYGEPVYENISQVKGLLTKYIEGYKNTDQYRWVIIEKKSGQNIGQIAFCRVYPDCYIEVIIRNQVVFYKNLQCILLTQLNDLKEQMNRLREKYAIA